MDGWRRAWSLRAQLPQWNSVPEDRWQIDRAAAVSLQMFAEPA